MTRQGDLNFWISIFKKRYKMMTHQDATRGCTHRHRIATHARASDADVDDDDENPHSRRSGRRVIVIHVVAER